MARAKVIRDSIDIVQFAAVYFVSMCTRTHTPLRTYARFYFSTFLFSFTISLGKTFNFLVVHVYVNTVSDPVQSQN